MHEEHSESICTPLYQCIPLRCVWTREKRRNNDCYNTSNDSYSNDSYSTTVYSLEDAQKAVFEISDRVGTITMTFYYKDDVLLKQESVENYTLSKIDADNPLELLKNSSAEDEQKYKDLIGKGFEYKSAHNDDIFTVTYSFDYTKTDMKKLKEIEPNLRLTDDNTVSYSEFRDKLLKAGYVEK